jgi:hypothetical protein
LAKKENLPVVPDTNLPATEVPEWLQSYTGPMGTDNIDSTDINMPRLKLGQSMSPEVKDRLVNEGDLFHSITKEVLIPVGQKGIIIPICYAKEYVLWRDRSDGGGIFARAKRVRLPGGLVKYEWDKPHQEFTTKLGGKVKVTWKTGKYIEDDGLGGFGTQIPGDQESGPAATAHFNYVVMLPALGQQMVAISFNKSSAKKAKDLNAMLKMGNAPIFGRQFNLGAVPDQNNAGDKFFNYGITPAGFVASADLAKHLHRLHIDLSERGVNVDFSDEDGGSGGDGARTVNGGADEVF